jgi:hypothetical protein
MLAVGSPLIVLSSSRYYFIESWNYAGPIAPTCIAGFFLLGFGAARLAGGHAAPAAAEQERLEGELRDALSGCGRCRCLCGAG